MSDREVKRVIVALNGFTKELVQRLTLRIDANLKEDTPVDTGHAQSNWVPQIGSPFRGIVGSKESPDNSASQQGLATVLSSYNLAAGPVYISNNVPYVKYLDQGTSQQAPQDFIRIAVDRGIRQVNKNQ